MDISCLISVYEKADPTQLREALASVYEQTLLPNEVVLIEDGPLTSELDAVIAGLSDDPLVIDLAIEDDEETIRAKLSHARSTSQAEQSKPQLIIGRFAENVLLGRALAAGVHLCAGPYIARMDADDIAYPDRFEVQVKYLEEHPQVDVLGGAIEEFNDEGLRRIKSIPSGDALLSYAKYRCPVNHMTVMMKKDAVLTAGNYHHYPGLEDYELWSRALGAGIVFDNMARPLVHARIDTKFYDRRGGTDYGKRYMELRRQQRRDGLLSRSEYLKAKMATAVMVYAPSGLRKIIYKIIRRES